ncbi:MAG TPA: hypothetical protein VJH21_02510 [Candidatus Paceibacterota bacterium]
MRRFTFLAFALLCALVTTISSASAGEPFKWKYVGGDPYKCPACTDEKAMEISRIPFQIAAELLHQVEDERQGKKKVVRGEIRGGDHFDSVTFGMKMPGVKFNVDATFDGAFFTNAYYVGEWTFHHVYACGNWTAQQIGKPMRVAPTETPDRDQVVQFTCPVAP